MSESFERVSRDKPCIVCGKASHCFRLARFHGCMRVESNRPCEKLGWLHPIDCDPGKPLPPIPKKRPRMTDKELDIIWRGSQSVASRSAVEVKYLAEKLGVSRLSLLQLEVSWHFNGGQMSYWAFPERSARGMVLGVTKRLEKPTKDNVTKLFGRGGRRGLTYKPYWTEGDGKYVYLVEGASDTACFITMALKSIGRPNNTGGVVEMARMLRHFDHITPIVVGENDRKPSLYLSQLVPKHDPKCRCCNRCFPGKHGAIETAKGLAERLKRAVRVVYPPKGFKDVREWFKGLGVDPNDAREARRAGDKWRELTET